MAGIVPPFTRETANKKVKAAQDLWNTKNPEKVALAYTVSPLLLLNITQDLTGDAHSRTRGGGTATRSSWAARRSSTS